MVKGLELFREHFKACADNYVLIGGAACDLLLTEAAISFRATRDLDIVLCVEALNANFGRTFWAFIKAGQYQIQEKADGKKKFYRFRNPAVSDYPEMLELFSRQPDVINIAENSRLTPIPIDDDVSSLSAILLDGDYYDFIQANRIQLDGISLLSPACLIVLKGKAWLDLSMRKQRGESLDSKNIKKHKNDVYRLFAIVAPDDKIILPASIQADIVEFLNRIQSESPDFKALGLPFTQEQVIAGLYRLFAVAL